MKFATILSLAIGDAVRDRNGNHGTVVSFSRDDVAIRWGTDEARRYTDMGLNGRGVVKASVFDAEDTRPE